MAVKTVQPAVQNAGDREDNLIYQIVRILNALSVKGHARCITPPNFEIDTNFDIQNGDAFEIESAGVLATIATDQNFDTGTATVIATNAYWACAILSIDIDGTTYVDWGAEAVSEAAAKLLLSAVTASGEVVCGYVAVQAAAGQDFVAGTDALETGTGGQVSQDTNYYNDTNVGALAAAGGVDTIAYAVGNTPS